MNSSKTKNILLTVIGVILSLGFLGGFTYAWFNTTISGSGAQATVTTANLGNTVVSGVNITTPTGVLPGWVSNDGTITITNDEIDEEASVEYTCYVKKNNNNIKDLQYRISADNAISSVGGQRTDITRGGRQGIVSGTGEGTKTNPYVVDVS